MRRILSIWRQCVDVCWVSFFWYFGGRKVGFHREIDSGKDFWVFMCDYTNRASKHVLQRFVAVVFFSWPSQNSRDRASSISPVWTECALLSRGAHNHDKRVHSTCSMMIYDLYYIIIPWRLDGWREDAGDDDCSFALSKKSSCVRAIMRPPRFSTSIERMVKNITKNERTHDRESWHSLCLPPSCAAIQ